MVRDHLERFFHGHRVTTEQWQRGPALSELPELRVLKIAPGPRTQLWTYATTGACAIENPDSALLEFFILAGSPDDRHIELATLVAWYQLEHRLGIGHTIPLGEPCLPNSLCDHFLLSTPYPFGPELEICPLDANHAHITWLLPITQAERDFKVEHGLEALESLFEAEGLEYWDLRRRSLR